MADSPDSQFTQTISRMISAGYSDAEIAARHSFAWRDRAKARAKEIRARCAA